MLRVFLFAAGLWLLGVVFRTTLRARVYALAILYGLVLALHLILPDDHGLRLATGGSALNWLLVGGVGAVLLGYRAMLLWMRQRAQPAAVSTQANTFSETELDRYARHIMLREIGGAGQKKLKQARVLVIGAGGLGSPALMYLAAAGVGKIGVIDDDRVEATNLQRQIIHSDDAIGTPKVASAKARMTALNPHVDVRPYNRRLTEDIAADLFSDYDMVLDGTDNFETRYLVNKWAVALGKPLIAAALTQWEGQISLYDPARGAPCYQCIFPQAPAAGLAPSCAEAGVLGPLPGVIGAMMAVEAVKEITGAGTGLAGVMMIYDALHGETRMITMKPRVDCPICGEKQ